MKSALLIFVCLSLVLGVALLRATSDRDYWERRSHAWEIAYTRSRILTDNAIETAIRAERLLSQYQKIDLDTRLRWYINQQTAQIIRWKEGHRPKPEILN